MAKGPSHRKAGLLTLSAFKVSVITALATIALYFAFDTLQFALTRNIEGVLLDFRFKLRGPVPASDDIVIVLVDDQSIAEIGRWPWDRTVLADLVDGLAEAGAKAVAIDMVYADPETRLAGDRVQALRALVADLAGQAQAEEALRDRLPAIIDNLNSDQDAAFGEAVGAAGNVLIPFAFEPRRSPARPRPPAPDYVEDAAYRTYRNYSEGDLRLGLQPGPILPPIPVIGRQAAALAHVNVLKDVDGRAPYEYPVVAYDDHFYPSFAVQAARLYLGYAPEEMAVIFGEGLSIGPIRIPTDEHMRLMVNFYGPEETFETYPFSDVYFGRVAPAAFTDKLVVLGANALGVTDVFVTPFSAYLPGVERNANIIDNILTRRFVERTNLFWLYDCLVIITVCLLVGAVGGRMSTLRLSFFSLALGAVLTVGNYLAFAEANMWLNFTFPALGLLFTYSCLAIYQYFTQDQRERMIKNAFDHYLHPALVERLCDNPDVLALGGEQKTLTVLFSDVRNFSSTAAKVQPDMLVTMMNEYFNLMTEIVLDHNGFLDKYLGDGLMAVYGAPVPMPPEDQAVHACRTALAMIEAVGGLREEWNRRGQHQDLEIGVGINTGAMIIGNMGSDYHFDYTVMGDDVIVGSRIEQINKLLGSNILITQSVAQLVEDTVLCREVDLVRIKGAEAPVRVFEVVAEKPAPEALVSAVADFDAGLAAFRARDWDQAEALFEKVVGRRPQDRVAATFINRCQFFREIQPAQDWDMVSPERANFGKPVRRRAPAPAG